MRPFVSVIIPNYNHGKYIASRIESVLGQSYGNFEVIILDDCSEDESRSVIEGFKGRGHIAQVLYNEKNSGSAFAQWRKGLEAASGELVWIAESDDICEPDMLETLVCAFEKDNSTVLSFCRSGTIDSQGRETGVFYLQKDMDSFFAMEGRDFVRKYLSDANRVVNASSALFLKSAALSLDGAYASFKSAGDWLFWIKIALQGRVAYCPKAMNSYRIHLANTTSRHEADGTGIMECRSIEKLLGKAGLMSACAERKRKASYLYKAKYKLQLDAERYYEVENAIEPDICVRAAVLLMHFKHFAGSTVKRFLK